MHPPCGGAGPWVVHGDARVAAWRTMAVIEDVGGSDAGGRRRKLRKSAGRGWFGAGPGGQVGGTATVGATADGGGAGHDIQSPGTHHTFSAIFAFAFLLHSILENCQTPPFVHKSESTFEHAYHS